MKLSPSMGNWRTVIVEGTCAEHDVAPLREFLDGDWRGPKGDAALTSYGPLTMSTGLCALGKWPAATILASGNLAERDYTPEDVAEHLRRCAEVAPSLTVKVHCGGEWEADECVATVHLHDGVVHIGPPERTHVVGVSEDALRGRLLDALLRPAHRL
jgi:hypothetical protein